MTEDPGANFFAILLQRYRSGKISQALKTNK